jgi:hypothetical protein
MEWRRVQANGDSLGRRTGVSVLVEEPATGD